AAQIDHRAAVLNLIEDRPVALVLPECRLGARIRRDRAHDGDDPERVAAPLDRDRELRAKLAAVLVECGDLLPLDGTLGRAHEGRERAVVPGAIPLRDQAVRGHADGFRARPSEELLGLGAPRGDDAVRVLLDVDVDGHAIAVYA